MTNETTNIRWFNRTGLCSTRTFADLAAAASRLAYLEEAEALTRQVMPTDSSDVRFSDKAEADAIRDLLNQRTD